MLGKKLLRQSQNSVFGIFIAFIVLCIILSILSPHFLNVNNLLNVVVQISINFTIAVGMTFVILKGGIDLSVGSNVALVGLFMAIFMKNLEMPVFLSISIALVIASLFGLINGVLITVVKLPPFIATLGMMSVLRGIAFTVTGGQPVFLLPEAMRAITGRIYNIPVYILLIMGTLFAVAAYVLKYTRFGRQLYAIGGNEVCAHLSGIRVKTVKCSAYVISGLCCGIASVLLTSRLDSAVPVAADGAELNAIAAVVIGGVSMRGGEGSLIGTLIGSLIIGVVANGMNLLNVAQGAQRTMMGVIIIVAVSIDVMRRHFSAKRAAMA